MTTDILNPDTGQMLCVDNGETLRLDFTVTDEKGVQINAAALKTLLLTLTGPTGAIINGRDDEDLLLPGSIATIQVDGTIELRLEEEDNPFVSGGEMFSSESHHVLLEWTWDDGVATEDRRGIKSWRYMVTKVK